MPSAAPPFQRIKEHPRKSVEKPCPYPLFVPSLRRAFPLLAALMLLLSACAPFVRPEQPNQTDAFVFKPGERIGQTLTPNFAGMNGIEVYLAPKGDPQGQVTLHLRQSPQAESDLAAARLPAEQVTAPGFYRFAFPAQPRSRQGDYYFVLEFEGRGALRVGRAPGAAYLDGSAYVENAPAEDAQLAFLLDYEPRRAALGLAGEALRWGWYLLLAAWLFVLPGWAVVSSRIAPSPHTPAGKPEHGEENETREASAQRPRIAPSPHTPLPGGEGLAMRNPTVRLALAAAAGLALYPILLLWTRLAGLHLGRAYALLPGAAALAWLAWKRRAAPSPPLASLRRIHPADWSLLLLLTLMVFSRFWPIRTLEGPMWGDGMQHTMVTQLLLDHRGLFDSWQPYAEMPTFTYHFGFHTAAALLAWLTGMPARFAALWMGQILNLLAVLGVYPLAWKLSRGSRWAATGAVLAAGLLSPMPAFYLNWGRYTQLAGQVILPAALFVTWDWLDRGAPLRRGDLALGAVLWGGLGLTHYRVLVMGLAGVAACLLVSAPRWRELLPRTLALGAAGGALALPWYLHAFAGKLTTILAAQVRPASPGSAAHTAAAVTGDLRLYLPPWGWILLLLGAGLALWQRRPWARRFGLWWLLLLIAAYPGWLGLPGSAIVGYFTVLIAVYLPAAFYLSSLLPRPERAARWQSLLLGAALLAAGLWGLRARLGDIAPQNYAILTRPDVRAAAWVRENTSPQARFLIDNFTAYNGTAAVGADGGWWLSTLTGRAISHPPLLYTFEADPYPGFRQDLLDLSNTLRQRGPDAPETLALLRRRGITHVYIGQQQGRVNSPAPALRPQALLDSRQYRLLYHQDRVWIFEVLP